MRAAAAAVAINQMALPTKLEKNDKRWFEYNNSFENCTVTPSQLADQIRDGHGYTAWHDPHYRHSANWQKSQFIAVDLDTEDERSSFGSILKKPLVVAYGTLLHSTASHKPDAPRSRVIFFLDRAIESADGYTAACTFLSKCLGGDKACTDPSRGFFGAKDCMCEEIGSVLPLDVMRKMYRAFHDKIPPRRPQRQPSQPLTDDEKYERIAEALSFIPKWGISYDEWFTVIAAIKNELGDAGFNLALNWGSEEEGDVAQCWKGTRRNGGKLSRIGTIIHIASLHGFDPKRRQSEAATPETSRPR